MVRSIPTLLRGWRVALLLAVACLTPGRASAECGDYVTILNGPGASAHQPMPGANDGATPNHENTPSPVKPPCHGPNCSSTPDLPFPPLAPIAPVGTQVKELTGHLHPATEADAGPGRAFDRDTTSARPIRRASSVFHPPQSA